MLGRIQGGGGDRKKESIMGKGVDLTVEEYCDHDDDKKEVSWVGSSEQKLENRWENEVGEGMTTHA